MVAVLACTMSVTAFAATEGKIEAEDSAIVNNYDPVQHKPDTNPDDGEEYVVGIKPISSDAPCTLTFTVNVDTAGTYTISVRYNAKSGKDPVRGIAMTVNEADVELATENVHNDYNSYDVTTVDVSLNAGDNAIVLSSVADKSPVNVDWLAWDLKEAAAPDTEAPATSDTEAPATSDTEAPAVSDTEAPAGDSTDAPTGGKDSAPQTGFVTVALAVVAAMSAGYIVSRNKAK